jgi:hypothetical protein
VSINVIKFLTYTLLIGAQFCSFGERPPDFAFDALNFAKLDLHEKDNSKHIEHLE